MADLTMIEHAARLLKIIDDADKYRDGQLWFRKGRSRDEQNWFGERGIAQREEIEEARRAIDEARALLDGQQAGVDAAIKSVRDAELFADGVAGDLHCMGITTRADAYVAGRQHALDELDALLRLPAGEPGEAA